MKRTHSPVEVFHHVFKIPKQLLLFVFMFFSFSVLVTAQEADLGLTKSVNDSIPEPGQRISFTITLINHGPNVATGVAVRDSLPSGYGSISNISNGGDNAGRVIIWSNITIQPNDTIPLTLTATVLPSGDYYNRAEIIASSASDPNSNPLQSFDEDDLNDGIPDNDETDMVRVYPKISDLSVTKTFETQDDNATNNLSPHIGTTGLFTITVTNNGPSATTGVVVEDILPEGFIYQSDTGSGLYSSFNGSWSVGSLENGETATLEITVVINSTGNYTNTVSVTASDNVDPDETNNVASVTLTPTSWFIPQGFSPNGDGINDTFELPGFGYLFPDFKLEVFNRWGNKVHVYNNNGRTSPVWWDGNSDGKLNLGSGPLPSGTYYYVIYFNKDNLKPVSDWVYLNR